MEGLLKTSVVVLIKEKLVVVAEDVGVSTDAATYVVETTFATPDDVHSMSTTEKSPQRPTSGSGFVWKHVDGLGIQEPSWPVVLRVSNIVRTFKTRSAKPGVPDISSATRSSE